MKNAYQNYLYTDWYLEDLEWLKSDLIFFNQFNKPEVKEMYKPHLEWEILQLKKLKDKIKIYEGV